MGPEDGTLSEPAVHPGVDGYLNGPGAGTRVVLGAPPRESAAAARVSADYELRGVLRAYINADYSM